MKTKTVFYCTECGNETQVGRTLPGLRRMEQYRGADG